MVGGAIEKTLDLILVLTASPEELRQMERDRLQMATLYSLQQQRYEARENAAILSDQMQHLGERLTGELRAVGGMLEEIHGEMEQARRLQEEQLAVAHESLDLQRKALGIQRAMLKSQRLQSRLQEFVYQFQKAVTQFSSPGVEYPATTRLLVLKGFLAQVVAENIDTPVIEGLDAKRAFDETREKARRLVAELSTHPDVVAAVEWARQEQRRLKEEEERQRREAERRRLEQEAEEKRRRHEEEKRRRHLQWWRGQEKGLKQQVSAINGEIKNQEKKLVTSFDKWFKGRFGFGYEALLGVSLLLSLLSCCGAPLSVFVIDGPPESKAAKEEGKQPPSTAEKGKGKGEVTVGSFIAGMLCVVGVPGPWLLVGIAYMVFSSMHKKAVDVKKDQEELDRTVNAEALAEIARQKQKMAPLNQRLAQVREKIAALQGSKLAGSVSSAEAGVDPDLADLERLEREAEEERRNGKQSG